MFFSSVFTPSCSLPTGRSEMLASQRSEPSSMFTSETPEHAHRGAQQPQPLAGGLGGAQVGLGDDLRERGAAAVEVDDRGVGAVDAPGGADVHELGGVLLQVHAVDAHLPQPPARGRAASRTGRSGSPWEGRGRSSSCGGRSTAAPAREPSARPIISPKCTARALATGRLPGRPRQTGQVRVLGGSPKESAQPQNIFVAVASWTWISRPMTGSYAAARRTSPGSSRGRSRRRSAGLWA